LYNERDQVSTKRIMLTLGGIVLGLAAVLAVASGVINAMVGPVPSPQTESATATMQPEPSASVVASATVVATVPATVEPEPVAPKLAAPKPQPAKPKPTKTFSATVVIDAGHQQKADSSLEPIGPGATEMKPKVSGGTSGVATHNSESSVNLEVAKRLRDELESRGVKVVMVRSKQDVNIANSKRAQIANDAHADVFIRLHCDGNNNHSLHGLSTLIPAKNSWTAPIVDESKTAGRYIHDAVVKSSGAADRGLVKRSDLSGFNWAKVPTVLVEMGFMSNSAEDRKLDTAAYQKKLAEGMANGIMKYLASK
jgi:N-acetylmuramoyl-L-alanine amidase